MKKLTKSELEAKLVEGRQDFPIMLKKNGETVINTENEECIHVQFRSGKYAEKYGKIALVALCNHATVPDFGHEIHIDGTLVSDSGHDLYTLEVFVDEE